MTFELSSENQNFGKLVFVTVSLKASEFFLFSYLFIYLFIYGGVGSSLLCGLSLVAASRGYCSLQCAGFSLRWLLLLQSTGFRHVSFSSCGTWAQELWFTGSRAQAQKLWLMGSRAQAQ